MTEATIFRISMISLSDHCPQQETLSAAETSDYPSLIKVCGIVKRGIWFDILFQQPKTRIACMLREMKMIDRVPEDLALRSRLGHDLRTTVTCPDAGVAQR
jgi:hypothetical protein